MTEFSKTFLVFYKWPDLTDVQGVDLLTSTVRSFEITRSFGRENDVRSEQALRNGKVALECMHMYS